MQKHRPKTRSARKVQPGGHAPAHPAPRRFRRWKWGAGLLAGAAAIGLLIFARNRAMDRSAPPVIRCEIVASYPHAPDAFTQGLVYEDGFFYEGTGREGTSSLRKVEVESGKVVQQIDLDPRYFGEGIAVVGDEIYQLTWKSRLGFVYDKQTFQKLREFQYTGEGWGLTYDGRHLIMSDGTDTLRFFRPESMQEVRRLQVTSEGRRLEQLNELEFADGFIYANIWYSDYLVKISPHSGAVVAWIDARRLWPANRRPDRDAVLNGIAYDKETGKFFLTGKNWPKLFEVRIGEPTRKRLR